MYGVILALGMLSPEQCANGSCSVARPKAVRAVAMPVRAVAMPVAVKHNTMKRGIFRRR